MLGDFRHRPRGRPGRHGGRLRGRADLARPPGGAEGPALRRGARPAAAPAVPDRGAGGGLPAPRPHRAGLRRRLRAGRATTTPCSSSRAAAWPRSSPSCAGSTAWTRPTTRPAGRASRPRAGRPAARRAGRARRTGPAARRSATPRPPDPTLRLGRDRAARRRLLDPQPGLLPHRGPARRAGGRGAGPRPRRWASSTATSSRPTCCSTPGASSGSPTSAWPRSSGDAGLTLTGDLLGTLRYMSPEQALARRVVDRPPDRHLLAGRDALRAADAAAGLRRPRPAGAPAADRRGGAARRPGGSTRRCRATWRRSS